MESRVFRFTAASGRTFRLLLALLGGDTVRVKKALRPGGLVVIEGFHADAAKARGGKIGSGVVFDTDELKKRYAGVGLKILRYEEPMGAANFSRENLRLVKLVAQKH